MDYRKKIIRKPAKLITLNHSVTLTRTHTCTHICTQTNICLDVFHRVFRRFVCPVFRPVFRCIRPRLCRRMTRCVHSRICRHPRHQPVVARRSLRYDTLRKIIVINKSRNQFVYINQLICRLIAAVKMKLIPLDERVDMLSDSSLELATFKPLSSVSTQTIGSTAEFACTWLAGSVAYLLWRIDTFTTRGYQVGFLTDDGLGIYESSNYAILFTFFPNFHQNAIFQKRSENSGIR